METGSAWDRYQSREDRFRGETDALERKSRLISNLRGLSFGLSVVLVLFTIFGESRTLMGTAALCSSTLFGVLIFWHSRVIEAEGSKRRWARVNELARYRLRGDIAKLSDDGADYLTEDNAYARDLDLFGPNSLFQRISVAHTEFGRNTLASYCSVPYGTQPATRDEIMKRQEAARFLEPQLELRQHFESLALSLEPKVSSAKPADARPPRGQPLAPLLAWAEGESELPAIVRWRLLARGLPVLLFGTWLLTVLGDLPQLFLLAPLTAQLVVVWRTRLAVLRTFAAVMSGELVLERFGPMLRLLEELSAEAPLIAGLRSRLAPGQPLTSKPSTSRLRPSLAMKQFARAVGWFELRLNGLAHPFVNAILLWDLQCLLALESWRKRYGSQVRDWFLAIGEFEALSSFAALAHDHEEFSWPEISEGPASFLAEDLAHPLIEARLRVGNDIALSEPGSGLLITGSNMSGKSTLLRAMGLGAVMALSGAPVCARKLVVSRLRVETSIRISDSLERGVSHFYAELARIKAVLEAAREGLPVFFLLDEILSGTNSRERAVGARWIITELLRARALGAISTHDLALCQLEPHWMQRVKLVHLRETTENGRMIFDYKLREGPVSGGNALRLMRSLGLDVPIPDESAG